MTNIYRKDLNPHTHLILMRQEQRKPGNRKQFDDFGGSPSMKDAAYQQLEEAYNDLCLPGGPAFEFINAQDPGLIQSLAQAFNEIFITLWPDA